MIDTVANDYQSLDYTTETAASVLGVLVVLSGASETIGLASKVGIVSRLVGSAYTFSRSMLSREWMAGERVDVHPIPTIIVCYKCCTCNTVQDTK